MVVAVCGLLFAGYPVALTLGGVSLAFAALGHALGAMDFGAPRRAAAAHLRRDDQRGAARDPAVHLHGRDAGAFAHRRGPARDHGPAVRLAARRPGHLGGDGRRAARGRQGRGRRDHRDHGPDHAADHAAPRLRPARLPPARWRRPRRWRRSSRPRPCWCCSATSSTTLSGRATRARASSRRTRSRSATCSPARSCRALRWSALYLLYPDLDGGVRPARPRPPMPPDPDGAARPRAGAAAARGAGRAGRC